MTHSFYLVSCARHLGRFEQKMPITPVDSLILVGCMTDSKRPESSAHCNDFVLLWQFERAYYYILGIGGMATAKIS